MGILEIFLIVVIALVIFSVGFYILLQKKPQLAMRMAKPLTPLLKLFTKTKKGKEMTEKMAIDHIAANPDQISDILENSIGRDQTRVIEKQLAGRSEEERREVMTTLMQKAERGESIGAEDMARRKTPEEMRAANKKKAAARAKRKRAKKQRRKK